MYLIFVSISKIMKEDVFRIYFSVSKTFVACIADEHNVPV